MITVKDIAKSYGELHVLKNVSFKLEKGTITVLMGANGSGKTTLFNIINGFTKQDKGEIIIGKKLIGYTEPHIINRLGIARTFQQMRLIGKLTVKENVLLAFQNQWGENWWNVLLPHKKTKAEKVANDQKAANLLKTCFLDDVVNQNANEISYGQQKLLNLACCMANDTQIILLDEPVAGVNLVYRDSLIALIQLLKRQGKVILIIEHNTDFIEKVADRILFLNEGYISSFDNYETLRKNPEVQESYI